MIEREKMDSYDEEDVHTYDERNQLMEEKKMILSSDSRVGKTLQSRRQIGKESIDVKAVNKHQTEKPTLHEDFVKKNQKFIDDTGKAESFKVKTDSTTSFHRNLVACRQPFQ